LLYAHNFSSTVLDLDKFRVEQKLIDQESDDCFQLHLRQLHFKRPLPYKAVCIYARADNALLGYIEDSVFFPHAVATSESLLLYLIDYLRHNNVEKAVLLNVPANANLVVPLCKLGFRNSRSVNLLLRGSWPAVLPTTSYLLSVSY
jgi:hypothetical protein